jgi:hypothetical protein
MKHSAFLAAHALIVVLACVYVWSCSEILRSAL